MVPQSLRQFNLKRFLCRSNTTHMTESPKSRSPRTPVSGLKLDNIRKSLTISSGSPRSPRQDTNLANSWYDQIFSWGYGLEGTLGQGEAANNPNARVIEGLSTVCKFTKITSGFYHCLALTDEGRIYTWGRGENGRLGHNDHVTRFRPKLLEIDGDSTLIRFEEVSGGSHHSLAVSKTGQLWAWGSGWSGQLGIGERGDSAVPRVLPNFTATRVISVAAGYHHSLAVTENGTVWAWGTGELGQLGLGEVKQTFKPLPLSDARVKFRAVAASEFHSAALTVDGALYTWGSGESGQLGLGPGLTQVNTPQLVSIPDVSFTQVVLGVSATLLLSTKGGLYFCGRELAPTTGSVMPCHFGVIPLQPVSVKFTQIALKNTHALALSVDGKIYSMGLNTYGQLGREGPEAQFSEVTVEHFKFKHIAAGANHSLAIAISVPSAPLNSPERTNQMRARLSEYSRELAEIREQKERLKRREKELLARCTEMQREIDAQSNRNK